MLPIDISPTVVVASSRPIDADKVAGVETCKVMVMPAMALESIWPPELSVVTMTKPVLGFPEYGFLKLSTSKVIDVPVTSLGTGFDTVSFLVSWL